MIRDFIHSNTFLVIFSLSLSVALIISGAWFIRKNKCADIRENIDEHKTLLAEIINFNVERSSISVVGHAHLDSLFVKLNDFSDEYYEQNRKINRNYVCGLDHEFERTDFDISDFEQDVH